MADEQTMTDLKDLAGAVDAVATPETPAAPLRERTSIPNQAPTILLFAWFTSAALRIRMEASRPPSGRPEQRRARCRGGRRGGRCGDRIAATVRRATRSRRDHEEDPAIRGCE